MQAITVPQDVAAKTRQKHESSAAHRRSCALRTGAERTFSTAKDPPATTSPAAVPPDGPGPADALARLPASRPQLADVHRLDRPPGSQRPPRRRHAAAGQAAALIVISSGAGEDYPDLIADSSATGFVPKAELLAASIRRILRAR